MELDLVVVFLIAYSHIQIIFQPIKQKKAPKKLGGF